LRFPERSVWRNAATRNLSERAGVGPVGGAAPGGRGDPGQNGDGGARRLAARADHQSVRSPRTPGGRCLASPRWACSGCPPYRVWAARSWPVAPPRGRTD